MPITVRPVAPYLPCSACSLGNDSLQGLQNVPQKSTSTTRPRRSLSVTVGLPPLIVATLKSGAGLPTRPEGSLPEGPPDSVAAAPHPASTVEAIAARHVRSENMEDFLLPMALPPG